VGVVALALALAVLGAIQGDHSYAVIMLFGAAWTGFNAAEVAWDVPVNNKSLRNGRRAVNIIFCLILVWWAVATFAY
jgi:hypothetical protein